AAAGDFRCSAAERRRRTSRGAKAMSSPGTTTALGRWLGRVAIGLALAGMYLPVLMTLVYSFNASRIGTVWTGFSLGGYRELFAQSDLWRALGASSAIGAAASSLSVIAGTLAAFGLAHWRPTARTLGQSILAL